MTHKDITKQVIAGDIKVLVNYHINQNGNTISVSGNLKLIAPKDWRRGEDYECIGYIRENLTAWHSPQAEWWDSLYMTDRSVRTASQAQRLIARSVERVHDALAAAIGKRARMAAEIATITI